METTPSFTLDELCALVELPTRTVRYYMQLGLVDRPIGANRGARYGSRHVDQLLSIRRWQAAGLSLERIRELLKAPEGEHPPPRRRQPGTVEVWSHLVIADGVELHIEPTLAALAPEQLRTLFRDVMAAYEAIRAGAPDTNNDEQLGGQENA